MAISTCTVKAYLNTGYDINNIPDNPSSLDRDASSVVTLDVLNCLPLNGEDSGEITVKAFSGLDEADYLSLYFSLNGITYYVTDLHYKWISLDTVVISFVVDAFTSNGGVTNISSISGITRRHHVSSDTFGEYTMDDEYLVPSQTLEMKTQTLWENTGYGAYNSKTIIASTINLRDTGVLEGGLAFTYKDSTTGAAADDKVTTPHVIPFNVMSGGSMSSDTDIDWHVTIATADGDKVMPSLAVGYFDGSDKYVQRGVARAQELGIESGIVSSYAVPNAYLPDTNGVAGYMRTGSGTLTDNGLKSTYLTSATGHTDMAFEYNNGYSVQNKRLLYGSLRKYGMISIASGNRVEFRPEEIRAGLEGGPQVNVVVDPRENGKPYFRFASIYGDTTSFNHVVAGKEWANAPISWQRASGSAVQEQKFINQNVVNKANWEYGASRLATSFVTEGISAVTSSVADGNVSALVDYGENVAASLFNNKKRKDLYYKERTQELNNMMIDMNVVAPQVAFPNEALVRDIVGNGVMIYRMTPTAQDLSRMDKVLNCYGYKVVEVMQKSFFTNRARYNYVEAADINIEYTNPVNKRMRELAEQQISAGIRVWHVKPDGNFTIANNIV